MATNLIEPSFQQHIFYIPIDSSKYINKILQINRSRPIFNKKFEKQVL